MKTQNANPATVAGAAYHGSYLHLVLPHGCELLDDVFTVQRNIPEIPALEMAVVGDELKQAITLLRSEPSLATASVRAKVVCETDYLSINRAEVVVIAMPNARETGLELRFADTEGYYEYSLAIPAAYWPADIGRLLDPDNAEVLILADLLADIRQLPKHCLPLKELVSTLSQPQCAALYAQHREAIVRWLVDSGMDMLALYDYRIDRILDQPATLVEQVVKAWAMQLFERYFSASM